MSPFAALTAFRPAYGAGREPIKVLQDVSFVANILLATTYAFSMAVTSAE
jgi:hypothetical protein